jgi:hypothetical protein
LKTHLSQISFWENDSTKGTPLSHEFPNIWL